LSEPKQDSPPEVPAADLFDHFANRPPTIARDFDRFHQFWVKRSAVDRDRLKLKLSQDAIDARQAHFVPGDQAVQRGADQFGGVGGPLALVVFIWRWAEEPPSTRPTGARLDP